MVPLPTYVYFLCVVVVFKESDFHCVSWQQARRTAVRTSGRNDGRRTHTRAKGTGTRIPEAKVADPPGLPRPPTEGQKVVYFDSKHQHIYSCSLKNGTSKFGLWESKIHHNFDNVV